MKLKPYLYGAAVLLGGYVAYRGYKTASGVLKSGGDAVTAAKTAAVKVITEDLNPASDKNLVYSGVNSVGAAVTGDNSFSLGSWLYNITHADELSVKPIPSTVANPQEDFRRSEIQYQNAEGARLTEADKQMSVTKSTFRLRELEVDKPVEFISQYDRFLTTLGGS